MSFSRGQGELVYASVDDRALLAAMGKLPKEVQQDIRRHNMEQASTLANDLIARARWSSIPQAKLLETAIKAKRDRLVVVELGGPKRVGHPYRSRSAKLKSGQGKLVRAQAGELVYGADHGSSGKAVDRAGRKMGRRFVMPHNERGYWVRYSLQIFVPELIRDWESYIRQSIRRQEMS